MNIPMTVFYTEAMIGTVISNFPVTKQMSVLLHNSGQKTSTLFAGSHQPNDTVVLISDDIFVIYDNEYIIRTDFKRKFLHPNLYLVWDRGTDISFDQFNPILTWGRMTNLYAVVDYTDLTLIDLTYGIKHA
jgi:hypothetical protein